MWCRRPSSEKGDVVGTGSRSMILERGGTGGGFLLLTTFILSGGSFELDGGLDCVSLMSAS